MSPVQYPIVHTDLPSLPGSRTQRCQDVGAAQRAPKTSPKPPKLPVQNASFAKAPVAVDFDGTIFPDGHFPRFDFEGPLPGAQEELTKLAGLGYEIHIYSCRTTQGHGICPWDQRDKMEAILNQYNIPYHFIHMGKPLVWFTVDNDPGFIPFRGNWKGVTQRLKKFMQEHGQRLMMYTRGKCECVRCRVREAEVEVKHDTQT